MARVCGATQAFFKNILLQTLDFAVDDNQFHDLRVSSLTEFGFNIRKIDAGVSLELYADLHSPPATMVWRLNFADGGREATFHISRSVGDKGNVVAADKIKSESKPNPKATAKCVAVAGTSRRDGSDDDSDIENDDDEDEKDPFGHLPRSATFVINEWPLSDDTIDEWRRSYGGKMRGSFGLGRQMLDEIAGFMQLERWDRGPQRMVGRAMMK